MSLLAVTMGADPSPVVDALRSVGWYGVNVCHRLACSGGRCDALSGTLGGVADGGCDTCGLRPVVEVSLYAQPGMVDSDVSACVEGVTCWCSRATRVLPLCCLRFLDQCGRAFW